MVIASYTTMRDLAWAPDRDMVVRTVIPGTHLPALDQGSRTDRCFVHADREGGHAHGRIDMLFERSASSLHQTTRVDLWTAAERRAGSSSCKRAAARPRVRKTGGLLTLRQGHTTHSSTGSVGSFGLYRSGSSQEFELLKTTTRQIVRHALHVTSLDRLHRCHRRSKGEDLGHLAITDRQAIFGYIYDRRVWLNGRQQGARSGQGSDLASTQVLREQLVGTLQSLGAHSLLDIGCGDFNWMRHVDLGDVQYVGVDVVQSLIEAHETAFGSPTRRFLCLDAVDGPLPVADVALCRDVMFHLSFADARRLIDHVQAAGIRYLVATSDTSTGYNADIRTGDYRKQNLQRRPYRFPAPDLWIPDDAVVEGRGLGVWSVADLGARSRTYPREDPDSFIARLRALPMLLGGTKSHFADRG